MHPLVLFSLYKNNLLKHQNRVIKTGFQRGFKFTKKTVYNEKRRILTRIKLVMKI